MPTDADAICFAPADYAPIHLRLAAMLCDLALLLALLGFGLSATALARMTPQERALTDRAQRQAAIDRAVKPVRPAIVWAWLGVAAAYHIGLRRRLNGGIGYWLIGLRIVTASGAPPAWRTMLRRFLIAVPATLLFGTSYLNCIRSPRRQAVHDLLSGTWAVRRKAQTAQPARVTFQTRFLGTYPITFQDLEPIESAPPLAMPPGTGI